MPMLDPTIGGSSSWQDSGFWSRQRGFESLPPSCDGAGCRKRPSLVFSCNSYLGRLVPFGLTLAQTGGHGSRAGSASLAQSAYATLESSVASGAEAPYFAAVSFTG
jgi:hypothetical protein